MIAPFLLSCAHVTMPQENIATLPPEQPDLMIAHRFEPSGNACEDQQLAGVGVSPECVVEGDADLPSLLDNPACRVPLPAADGFYCTKPHLLFAVDPNPVQVSPGATAMLRVSLTPAGWDDDVLVDFDPGAHPEVAAEPVPPLTHPCVLWATEPSAEPSRDRTRVLLRPGAIIRAQIPWHARWRDADATCNPVERPLPAGHYRLAVWNPAFPLEMQQADWEYGMPPSVRPLSVIGEVR